MAEADPPDVPPGFTAVSLFNDPTPNCIILNRIVRTTLEVSSGFTDLTKDESNEFLDLLFIIARKMLSVWKHLDAYQAEAAQLAKKFANPEVKHFEYSQVLYEEFDVFTVQIKSTLDHLVKVMRPMTGPSWNLYTFGDKGDKVLRALKGNTARKHRGRVKMMEHLLFNESQREWLGAAIDSRDCVNHGIAGGMNIRNFAVLRRPDGKVELPRWSDQQELGDAMKGIWVRFFVFVEDFIMCALHFRIPEDKFSIFKGISPPDSPQSPWRVMDAKTAQDIVRRVPFRPIE